MLRSSKVSSIAPFMSNDLPNFDIKTTAATFLSMRKVLESQNPDLPAWRITHKLEKLLGSLAKPKGKKSSYGVYLILALESARHLWNGGLLVQSLLEPYVFVKVLRDLSSMYKWYATDPSDDMFVIKNIYQTIIQTYVPLISPTYLYKSLQYAYEEGKIHEDVLRDVTEMIKKRLTAFTELDENTVSLKNFDHDIVRYYQRYCEPFQDPFKASACHGTPIRDVSRQLIHDLDRIFASAQKATIDLDVYRGVVLDQGIENFLSTSSSYKSTSASYAVASGFINKNPCCLLRLTVPKGTPLLSVNIRSDIFEENEYLLPRNATFVRDPSKDLTLEISDDIVRHVYGFRVELDRNFDFADIDKRPSDESLPPPLDVQNYGSFFHYIFNEYQMLQEQVLSHSQAIYDFLTRNINYLLYHGMYYNEIRQKLEEMIEEVDTDLIYLTYTDLLTEHDVEEFYKILPTVTIDKVLDGTMWRAQGNSFQGPSTFYLDDD